MARPTAIGFVIALLVVAGVVGWSLRGSVAKPTSPRITDAQGVGGPAAMTDDERAGAASGLDAQAMVHLESGAWVEVADPKTGRLAQRYSAARVEPLRDQWVRMESPRASFHTSGGRIVTLRGNHATARVPRRALESGRIEGDVVVHMYRPGPDGRIDPARDRPVVEILAEEADYDSGIGQLRCDGRVEVRTAAARFVGRGLTLLMERDAQRAEELVVDEALEPVTIDLVALRNEREGPGPDRAGATDGVAGGEPVDPATPSAPPARGTQVPSAVAAALVALPYRLTLHDDVVVRRIRDGAESVISGDRLALVFSLDSEGPGRELIGRGPSGVATPPVNLATSLVMMSIAATDEVAPVVSDVLEITYSGRLVMVQSDAEDDVLLTPDETIIEVHGTPARFEDPTAEVRGRCAMLRYRTGNGRVDLVGEPGLGAGRGMLVESPQGDLVGERLWLIRDRGVGRIEGAGTMTLRDRAPGASVAPPLALAYAANSPSDAGALSLSLLASIAAAIGTEIAPPTTGASGGGEAGAQSLEILWSDGVDLAFEPGSDGEEDGRLREAHFRGDVRVSGEEFAMRSDAMRVEFGAAGELGAGQIDDSISAIEATGGVNVDRLGDQGSMTCSTLLVTMQSHDGRSIPQVMTATGEVVARDAAQTIWSDEVQVTFRPRVESPRGPDGQVPDELATALPDRPEDDAQARGVADDEALGGAEVHTVNARGDVRVRMRDGALVFADRLDGDAIERRIQLTGTDVMLLRDRVVADRMSSVRFDETARTAHADGPGRFRLLVEAPSVGDEAGAERLRRPSIDAARPEVEAQWQRSMAIDERASGGAGAIDLRGDVHVVAEQDPLRRDTLRAESLVLELRHREGESAERAATGDEPEALAQTRDLARMIARTEADLQSRRWAGADRGGTPRLFRVRGQHVEHDAITGESLVVGNGQLLIHDPTPATEPEATGFGRRGTAIFGWTQRMEMRRVVDERFLITMEDGVEVLHEGVAPGDELTLTTDRLEATIDRAPARRDRAERGDDDNRVRGAAGDRADPFGLGGASELLRLRAAGVTFVGTPEYRVDCHEFDFDAVSGIARISARPGRVVRALVTRTSSPLQASEMVWDMRLGRLQITQGGGGAMR